MSRRDITYEAPNTPATETEIIYSCTQRREDQMCVLKADLANTVAFSIILQRGHGLSLATSLRALVKMNTSYITVLH